MRFDSRHPLSADKAETPHPERGFAFLRALTSWPCSTFALVENDGEAHGPIALPKRDWQPGELIPPGTMRVLGVIEPERDDRLPVLMVEPVGR
jgi:hypothetical protein